MITKKLIPYLALCAGLLLSLGAADSSDVQVVKIRKISIEVEGSTSVDFVRSSIVEFQETSQLDRRSLARALELIEYRLRETRYFSNVSAMAVDSESEANAVNVVVEVTDGFLFGFGGRPYYASMIARDWGGSGIDAGFSAGWNQQTLTWKTNALGGKPITVAVVLGNVAQRYLNSQSQPIDAQDVGFELQSSASLPWGFRFSAAEKWAHSFSSNYQNQGELFLTSLAGEFRNADFSPSPTSGLWASVRTDFSDVRTGSRVGADVRSWWTTPITGLKTAIRGNVQSLFGADETGGRLTPVVSGIDAVRKPMELTDSVTSFALFSAELRWDFWDVDPFQFATIRFEPALFFDAAYAVTNSGSKQSPFAYGLALRTFVDAPIDLSLRFEYSFDQKGQGTFFFAVENPF